MGGRVIICDAKKSNLKYRFLKSKKLFDVVNRNKQKYFTKTKKKETTFFLYIITYVCLNFDSENIASHCFIIKACFQNKKIPSGYS